MLQLVTVILLLPVAALATLQTVETWAHGSIFERPRAWSEAHQGLLYDLVLCEYCLSHWAAGFWSLFPFLYVTRLEPTWELVLLPMYVPAVARLAVTIHDRLHGSRNFVKKLD